MEPPRCTVKILSLLFVVVFVSTSADACRMNSELLKAYSRRTIEKLLVANQFGSVYWPDEPLPVSSLSKAIGINVTLAETQFHLNSMPGQQNEKQKNEIAHAPGTGSYDNTSTSPQVSMIQDIFVSCSIDRDRSYTLLINLELENPFKFVDIHYDSSESPVRRQESDGQNHTGQGGSKLKRHGSFRVNLPQSSLLVQLSQRIRYDDCLRVNYVQLAPTVNYELECAACDKGEQEHLDKIFTKRMSQLDAELDAAISEKVLFGLQALLSQQRLDLDMYLD